mgnify:CR=1 FL=1
MTIFVGNLSYKASEQDLKRLFESYGDVMSAYIPKHAKTEDPKGYGFVKISLNEEGLRVIETLNGTLFMGRELTIEEAKNRNAIPPKGRVSAVAEVDYRGTAEAGRSIKRVFLGTLGYIVIYFPLAVLWHNILFPEFYDSPGYFSGGYPNFLFGFFSIFLQGLVLTVTYGQFISSDATIKTGLKYSYTAGIFLWTCHVVPSYAAKHPLSSNITYFSLETLYLAIQFTLFGCVLSFINRSRSDASAYHN